MSILTVGTVAFDEIETPFGASGKIVGGAANYIALSASHFTDAINLVSVVGEDFPQEHLDLLKNKQVDLKGLQIKQGEKSFFWKGKYHDDMISRDTLITELNVLETFAPEIPAEYQGSKYVMLGNLTPAIQLQVLEDLKEQPKLVVTDTMDFWMNVALDDLKKVLAKTDVLTINDEEARLLSGKHNLIDAAETIQEFGPKYLIIKKGEHGAILFHPDGVYNSPAMLLPEVIDPTGAGDCFAGGFIGYLAQTQDHSFENMKKAVAYGTVMASHCVEHFGTTKMNTLSPQQVVDRLAQFKAITSIEW